LFKNSPDRVALHPVLHIYVHSVLYENENPLGSSKISSFINVTYDRHWRTTPLLEHSNFVEVMEASNLEMLFEHCSVGLLLTPCLDAGVHV
jgi:hypothetical protein